MAIRGRNLLRVYNRFFNIKRNTAAFLHGGLRLGLPGVLPIDCRGRLPCNRRFLHLPGGMWLLVKPGVTSWYCGVGCGDVRNFGGLVYLPRW